MCACRPGYLLAANGRTCIPEQRIRIGGGSRGSLGIGRGRNSIDRGNSGYSSIGSGGDVRVVDGGIAAPDYGAPSSSVEARAYGAAGAETGRRNEAVARIVGRGLQSDEGDLDGVVVHGGREGVFVDERPQPIGIDDRRDGGEGIVASSNTATLCDGVGCGSAGGEGIDCGNVGVDCGSVDCGGNGCGNGCGGACGGGAVPGVDFQLPKLNPGKTMLFMLFLIEL